MMLMVGVVVGGGVSSWRLGNGDYGLGESVYFSLYTVATVGYAELPHMERRGRSAWSTAS